MKIRSWSTQRERILFRYLPIRRPERVVINKIRGGIHITEPRRLLSTAASQGQLPSPIRRGGNWLSRFEYEVSSPHRQSLNLSTLDGKHILFGTWSRTIPLVAVTRIISSRTWAPLKTNKMFIDTATVYNIKRTASERERHNIAARESKLAHPSARHIHTANGYGWIRQIEKIELYRKHLGHR